MQYITSLALVLAVFISMPDASRACSCVAPRAPLVELAASDAVFSAVVKSITPFSTAYGKTHMVKLQVLSRWKGELNTEIYIQTADNSAACGYPFEKGTSYVIYANMYDNFLHTGLCTRTARLEHAEVDLQELGEGERVSTYRPRCGGPTSAVVLQTILFLYVGLLFSRKGRFAFWRRTM